ncbi:hypothetical protein [Actinoalloteichus spitiensis]|uniref:hypothetical protein n=1 Tax=Actinoalloteichus spitiensis TaxID=252394 RepID=UPI00036870BA|nr:hypothetical protein [Actinoalloteichus spitiensis]
MSAGLDEDSLDERRFAVRADAFFVRHEGGVWLRNNLGSFSIRGAGAYQLVGSLFANLDGERSVAEICEGLPESARRSVSRLVGTLDRNGFLREVVGPKEVPPEWMAELYPVHLAFLEHHADRPVSRLSRVRSTLVGCLGSGVALRAALGALGEFGVARLLVVCGEADEASAAELMAAVRERDPRVRWRLKVVDGSWPLASALRLPELRDAGQVLLVTDDADPVALADAHHLARGRGQDVGVLGRCGDHVVALPPGVAGCCWECAHRSVAARVAGFAGDLPPAPAPAAVAALHLVQQVFARLAGVALEGAGAMTTVEPCAPVVRQHTARRHPLCSRHPAGVSWSGPLRAPVTGHGRARTPSSSVPAALSHASVGARPRYQVGSPPEGEGGATGWSAGPGRGLDTVRPDVPRAEDPAELVAEADRIVAVTARWTDSVTGPLLAVGEGDLDQLPLAASSCQVVAPESTACDPRTRLLVCRALSAREARHQVVLRAVEWLAARTARALGQTAPLVLGAGWTVHEARLRARYAAVAASRVPTAGRWEPAADLSTADTPARRFLVRALAGSDRAWCGVAWDDPVGGLRRVRVRTAAGTTHPGTGLTADHAIDNALLAALAAGSEDAGDTVGWLAPPTATWTEAARRASPPGSDALSDVTGLLPFADGEIHLVALSPGVGA